MCLTLLSEGRLKMQYSRCSLCAGTAMHFKGYKLPQALLTCSSALHYCISSTALHASVGVSHYSLSGNLQHLAVIV